MSILIIPATKSLTVTNKLPNENIKDDIISIGTDGEYNYISYLFFDISAISNEVYILEAQLVLFKTNNFYNNLRKEFNIYPLSEYFSTYSTYNNHPSINGLIKASFYPLTTKVAVTANLTYFVSLWIKNQLTNTGIALIEKQPSVLTTFGSALNKDRYLIPFIRVVTTPIIRKTTNYINQTPTTKQIQVIGTVAPDSVYDAIVNVGVERGGTGHTDNYYVTDEYDNSNNYYPLNIDKTYNLAIIPKEETGDTETTTLYGAYKT